jgi:hypothetical protein
VNQFGSVLAGDYAGVNTDLTTTDASYSPLYDVDGSGSVLANDFSEVKKRFFDALPGPTV